MLANVLLLAFLIGMVLWWGVQGFFSAFLHLLTVILAMVITLALWESFAYMMLETTTMAAPVAWSVALLAPFIILLGAFRLLLMKLVPNNVYFQPLVNNLLGGAVGVAIGILVSGFTIIGLNFLPIPGPLAGYQPYILDSDGSVIPNPDGGRLWFNPDRVTMGVLSRLSAGSLSSARPMDLYLGNLIEQGSLLRLAGSYDPNISMTSAPSAVEVRDVVRFTGVVRERDYQAQPSSADEAVVELPGNIASHLGSRVDKLAEGHDLVFVHLAFKHSRPMVDPRGTLRVPPSQVRLVTTKQNQPQRLAQRLVPLGTVGLAERGENTFYPSDSLRRYYSTQLPADTELSTYWVFMVPPDEQPRFVTVRNVRYDLGKIDPPGQIQFAALESRIFGEEELPADDRAADTIVYARDARLPWRFSRNEPTAQGFRSGSSPQALVSGRGTFGRPSAHLMPDSAYTSIDYLQASEDMVRIEFDRLQSVSAFLMRARSVSLAENPLWLKVRSRDGDQELRPVAFAVATAAGRLRVHALGGGNVFERARDIPILDLVEGDTLHVYYRIPKDGTPLELGVGDRVLVRFTDADETDENGDNG